LNEELRTTTQNKQQEELQMTNDELEDKLNPRRKIKKKKK
jgi:hypothetical protein